MQHPRNGERVFVRPTNSSVPVQRGDGLFGQVLAPAGEEVLWDEFLHRRLAEGSIAWTPFEKRPAAPIGDPVRHPMTAREKELRDQLVAENDKLLCENNELRAKLKVAEERS